MIHGRKYPVRPCSFPDRFETTTKDGKWELYDILVFLLPFQLLVDTLRVCLFVHEDLEATRYGLMPRIFSTVSDIPESALNKLGNVCANYNTAFNSFFV